jgi:hypothetical protein
MGISTTTAARIFDGQSRDESGEENVLSWEKFPYTALSKTYNTDAQVPDSAGTATAFASGVKTDAGEDEGRLMLNCNCFVVQSQFALFSFRQTFTRIATLVILVRSRL